MTFLEWLDTKVKEERELYRLAKDAGDTATMSECLERGKRYRWQLDMFSEFKKARLAEEIELRRSNEHLLTTEEMSTPDLEQVFQE